MMDAFLVWKKLSPCGQKNISTILTLANFSSKKEADDLIEDIHEKIKKGQTNY